MPQWNRFLPKNRWLSRLHPARPQLPASVPLGARSAITGAPATATIFRRPSAATWAEDMVAAERRVVVLLGPPLPLVRWVAFSPRSPTTPEYPASIGRYSRRWTPTPCSTR